MICAKFSPQSTLIIRCFLAELAYSSLIAAQPKKGKYLLCIRNLMVLSVLTHPQTHPLEANSISPLTNNASHSLLAYSSK